MISPPVPSQSIFANFVSPFAPAGKQAVGLENEEGKEEIFTPVEESQSTSAFLNEEDGREHDIDEVGRRSGQESSAEEDSASDSEQDLSEQDLQLLRELAATDREVRAHEQAHSSAAGNLAGATSLEYTTGPDGVAYAVAGEVAISFPGGSDPEANLAAAEQIQRAALAPASPSAQDRQVAASAAQLAADSRIEIIAQQREQLLEQAEAGDGDDETVAENTVDSGQAEDVNNSQAHTQTTDDNAAQQRRLQLVQGNLHVAELKTIEDLENRHSAGSLLDQTA